MHPVVVHFSNDDLVHTHAPKGCSALRFVDAQDVGHCSRCQAVEKQALLITVQHSTNNSTHPLCLEDSQNLSSSTTSTKKNNKDDMARSIKSLDISHSRIGRPRKSCW